MASEDPVQQEQPPVPEKAPVELYKVHSMVRAVETRLQRMQAPVHHRFVQRLGGGAITVRRARPATVTRAQLERHLVELKKAVAEGKIVVKTPAGGIVDLNTFTVIQAPPMAPPRPNPPADSAARDITFPAGVGEKIEPNPGSGVEGENPELNIQKSLTSEDQAISVTGDPAKARAAQVSSDEDLEELLGGDDEDTKPDALQTTTEKSGKKSKREKGGNK